MGTSLPSISFADEAVAPARTAQINAFKSFVKKDLKLEEEVKPIGETIAEATFRHTSSRSVRLEEQRRN